MGEAAEVDIEITRLSHQEWVGRLLMRCGQFSLTGTLLLFPFIMFAIGFVPTIVVIVVELVLLTGGYFLNDKASTLLRESDTSPSIAIGRLDESVLNLIIQEWWGKGMMIAGCAATLFFLQMSSLSGTDWIAGLNNIPFLNPFGISIFILMFGAIIYYSAKKRLSVHTTSTISA
ncbi:MAG: hypothetical protein ACW98U_01045 [Candidatus Thorarchaeota archaeon]|jgi:hypothetical protein